MAIDDYSDIFDSAGKQYGVDPQLLRAVATTESGGDPAAVNAKTNARGLMQLIPATAKSLGVNDPTDPTQAINGAAKLLAENIKRYKSPHTAILAYHGGTDPANWGDKTHNYLNKVMGNYQPPVNGKSIFSSFVSDAEAAPVGADNNAPISSTGDPYEDAIAEAGRIRKNAVSPSLPTPAAASTPINDEYEQAIQDAEKIRKQIPTITETPANNAPQQPVNTNAPEPTLGDNISRGFETGVLDVGGSGVRAANYLMNKAGYPSETLQNLQSDIKDIGARNEKQYGSSIPYNIARAGENIGLTLLPINAATGAVSMLARAAPGAEAIASAINSNKLLSLLGKGTEIAGTGAAQGAVGNLLTSGTSDKSANDLIKEGAFFGAPVALGGAAIGKGARYIGNVAHAAVAPFTKAGQNELATKAIQNFAGGAPAVNAAELVPGSQPTLAEATGNAGIARLQNTMRDMPGSAVNPFVEREQANAAARLNALQGAAGTPQDVESAVAARAAQANENLQNIFQSKQPTNTQPIIDTIDSILAGPGGKRDAVVSSLNNIRSKIVNDLPNENVLPSGTNLNLPIKGKDNFIKNESENYYNALKDNHGEDDGIFPHNKVLNDAKSYAKDRFTNLPEVEFDPTDGSLRDNLAKTDVENVIFKNKDGSKEILSGDEAADKINEDGANYVNKWTSELQNNLENNGYKVDIESSNQSHSKYFNIENKNGDNITLRFSDHPDYNNSNSDVNIKWGDNVKDALSQIGEKFGKNINSSTPSNDPEYLYHSVRKQIGDLLDKKDLTNPAGKQAARELMQVQSSLDDAIEQGAPGFKDYLNNYSTASKPIDAMQWMQGLNLTDAKGDITLSKVQNAIKNANKLQAVPGTNAAKSLSNEQIGTLQSLRDDLLRKTNTDLGRSAGSNTVQNIGSQNFLQNALPGKVGAFVGNNITPQTVGGTVGGGIGYLTGHAAGNPLLGAGIGAEVGRRAGNVFSNTMQAKNAEIQNRLQQILLNPATFNQVNPVNGGAFGRLANTQTGSFIGRNYVPITNLLRNRLLESKNATP